MAAEGVPKGFEDCVIEPGPVRCPYCHGTQTKCVRTMPTRPIIRYRLCRECGGKFKTVQVGR